MDLTTRSYAEVTSDTKCGAESFMKTKSTVESEYQTALDNTIDTTLDGCLRANGDVDGTSDLDAEALFKAFAAYVGFLGPGAVASIGKGEVEGDFKTNVKADGTVCSEDISMFTELKNTLTGHLKNDIEAIVGSNIQCNIDSELGSELEAALKGVTEGTLDGKVTAEMVNDLSCRYSAVLDGKLKGKVGADLISDLNC
jgi:hypothetical protein